MRDRRFLFGALLAAAVPCCCGCGTTKQAEATQQLLVSDAVDRSIARIDFSPLAGQTVYFDTQYIKDHKAIGFVNSNYVISSLRQQLFAAGCELQEKPEQADYVVEARIGTLGNDDHNIVYGIPANNGLSAASTVLASGPPLPAMPEISIARREEQMGAAKLAAFAYHRETNKVVWQSGLSIQRSTATDSWVMGAGPFERGTIYDGWQFAGRRMRLPFLPRKSPPTGAVAAYSQEMLFVRPELLEKDVEAPTAIAETKPAEAGALQQAAAADPAATATKVQQAAGVSEAGGGG